MFRLSCVALASAILTVIGVRYAQRALNHDEVSIHPVSFLSVSQLYSAAKLPNRRAEAMAELTSRLGYSPTL